MCWLVMGLKEPQARRTSGIRRVAILVYPPTPLLKNLKRKTGKRVKVVEVWKRQVGRRIQLKTSFNFLHFSQMFMFLSIVEKVCIHKLFLWSITKAPYSYLVGSIIPNSSSGVWFSFWWRWLNSFMGWGFNPTCGNASNCNLWLFQHYVNEIRQYWQVQRSCCH